MNALLFQHMLQLNSIICLYFWKLHIKYLVITVGYKCVSFFCLSIVGYYNSIVSNMATSRKGVWCTVYQQIGILYC